MERVEKAQPSLVLSEASGLTDGRISGHHIAGMNH